MPNKHPTKFRRLALASIAVGGGLLALLLLLIFAYESLDPIHAALWHMRHGNTVSFDGHLFHLPLFWYRDPNHHPGQFGIQHAQFGSAPSIASGRITLDSVPHPLNDQAASAAIAAIASHLNQHELDSSSRWTTETLKGRTLAFRCAMQTSNGKQETLICQAVDSNLRILALTTGRVGHTQALHIIDTSE